MVLLNCTVVVFGFVMGFPVVDVETTVVVAFVVATDVELKLVVFLKTVDDVEAVALLVISVMDGVDVKGSTCVVLGPIVIVVVSLTVGEVEVVSKVVFIAG